MTRIEKSICAIVGAILAVSTVVTLTIAVSLSSKHNESTYSEFTAIGVTVLENDVNEQQSRLEEIYALWDAGGKMSSALKKGYVGTLSELYTTTSAIDKYTYVLFTDAEGNKLWQSDNCRLSSYDVSAAIGSDPQKMSGLYSDANIPLSCIYVSPIKYGDQLYVGTCLLGYDLSACEYLDEIKNETTCDVTIFGGDTRIATTLLNAEGNRNVGTQMDGRIKGIVIDNGGTYTSKAKIFGEEYFTEYKPITDLYGNVCGAYFAGLPTAENKAAFTQVVLIAVGAALVVLVISAFVVMYFTKRVVAKPIVEVSSLAESMSRGNLSIPDFTYKFANNELGDFALALQNTKHSLSDYINDISSVLNSMASGDFTADTSIKYEGDFEQIAASFAQIRAQLSEIVRNINVSSEQVLSGSSQMANGSQILANGTTTQANAIEELNATIINISEKTQVNAKNALNAKNLSAGVETSTVQQNEEMQSVMEAMKTIEKRSTEISNIINTIDDIAFQTNILALNAAVEAARAGDAGKGFAVVADEVRNLASKSAEAVNETTNLITATVAAVDNGTALVRSAVSSMKEITEKTKETTRLIDEISSASDAQAEAIRQVTVGLQQISDVVQQNSATAEETAASCEELSGQSRMLRTQIGKLKA